MPTRPLVTSYREDLRLFPDYWHKVAIAVALVTAAVYPFVASPQWLTTGNDALIAIVGSVALMILTGFAGQISLGHAAFFALGAYTAGIMGTRWGIPFWMSLPLSGVVAAGTGLAIGVFALRLKGLYLAIVTIGLLVFVGHVLLAFPEFTRGSKGLDVPMDLWFSSGKSTAGTLLDFREPVQIGPLILTFERKLFFLFALIAMGATFLARNIQRSNMGRAMMAVRDHDLAASTLGVNPTRAKILAFGVSSFLAGIAGAMIAYKAERITVAPDLEALNESVLYIAMIVLGGVGTVFGAVAGALVFRFLSPLALAVGQHIPMFRDLSSNLQSTILFAVTVMAFMVFEPLGLFGVWLRIKRYFLAWPFRY